MTTISPTTPADIEALIRMTAATGLFKPMEVQALREVLDDYFAVNWKHGHVSITCEEAGRLLGFAYYAPAAMTEGTWYLYWIVVRKDEQARGLGSQMLAHLEHDIAANHRGRVLFVETGSLPHYELTRKFYRKNGYEQHAALEGFLRGRGQHGGVSQGTGVTVFVERSPAAESVRFPCRIRQHRRRSPTSRCRRLPRAPDATRLGDISAQQWKSGIAAWLGWLFDGLDMHLYLLVALPFVAELLHADRKDAIVASRCVDSGRVPDRLGPGRRLSSA